MHFVPERLWIAGAIASEAVHQDGQELFTAVTLLAWLDAETRRPQPDVLGVPRATLLVRFDIYTVQGVWAAIMRDADVTSSNFHHMLAVHAQLLALARRPRVQREMDTFRICGHTP